MTEEREDRLSRVRAGMDATARAHGVGVIGVAIADQIYVEQVSGPLGAVLVDAAAPDLLGILNGSSFRDPALRPAVLSLAQTATQTGVALRQEGELGVSYACQRFGLFAAVLQGEEQGVSVIAKNTWILYEAVRDVLERGRGPGRDPEASASDRAALESFRASLEWVAATLREDTAAVCPLVGHLVAGRTASGVAGQRSLLPLLHAWHRLARMGRDPRRREILTRIRAESAAAASWEVLYQVAAEEVAQMNLIDVLIAGGSLPAESAAVDGNDAHDALELYREARIHLPGVPAEEGAMACAASVKQLDFLRVSATTGGGTFGHRVSYLLSSYLQPVGRDLAFLQRQLGRHEDALGTAEFVLARSMVDWMARHHPGMPFSQGFRAAINPLTGSAGSVQVAGLPDVKEAAGIWAPVLYYLAQPDGYAVWLVLADGTVVSSRIEDPAPALAPVFEALPYLSARPGGEIARQISTSPSRRRRKLAGAQLEAAYRALIPEEIDEALPGGGEQLILMTGPGLDAVPFAALRTRHGTYLVEDVQLSTCPSTTALHLLARSGAAMPHYRARAGLSPGDLVLGRSQFGEAYALRLGDAALVEVTLPPLPGAEAEARAVAGVLGIEPLLDAAATGDAVLQLGEGAQVVHVATHGFFNQSEPEDSFLALSGGPLTAGFLYELDRGLHAGLVVLSACQTALGGEHPDSTIGLTNSLLIAGAHAVVSTLWQIPDELTAPLMARFHRHLLAGASVAGGLRATQREALEDPATSDPYIWGAFKVTGLGEWRVAR